MFAPFGDVLGRWGLLFRGFAMLTRGYRVVRPPWGRIPHGTSSCHGPHPRTAHRRITGRIPARHIVVSRAASPHGTSSYHGPHPARHIVVSRAASRTAHRRAVGCIPHGLTGQTAPKGSHYSVAVGERSEPAEGGPPIIIGPKGVEHTVHAGRSAVDVRPLWGRTWEVGVALPRVRHAHPRL